MDLLFYIKKAIRIILLNKKVILEISKDKNATIPGIIFLSVGFELSLLGETIQFHRTFSQIIYIIVIYGLIFTVLSLIVTQILARLFKGKAQLIHFFRPLGFVYVLNCLLLLQFIPYHVGESIIITYGIWSVVLLYKIIKEVYNLNWIKTVLVIILSGIILGICYIILMVPAIQLNIFNPEQEFGKELGYLFSKYLI